MRSWQHDIDQRTRAGSRGPTLPDRRRSEACATNESIGLTRASAIKSDGEFVLDRETYLIFLSHKVEVKEEAHALKEGLEFYGVEAFVAHSDIDPGTEWQDEILGALEDMDAFVPILTEGFRDSQWTDQEVGYAIASEVPIIPLRMDLDPYGFMGKYQGLSCDWNNASPEIIRALIHDPKLVDAFINATSECRNFASANRLAEMLPSIETLTDAQVSRLVSVFNENEQIVSSYGFNGTTPNTHGEGLPALLREVTGHSFLLKEGFEGRLYIQPPSIWIYRAYG